MKKIIAFTVLCMLLTGAAFPIEAAYDAKAKQFQIEKGAKIRLGMDNDKAGAALVELWDKTHPTAKGVVEYVNFGAQGSADQITAIQGEAPDVVLAIDGEVSRNAQSLLALHSVIVNAAKGFGVEPFFSGANSGSDIKYVPIA